MGMAVDRMIMLPNEAHTRRLQLLPWLLVDGFGDGAVGDRTLIVVAHDVWSGGHIT